MSAESIQPKSTEDVSAVIDYCGEIYEVRADQEFLIGREADLCIDDNPYIFPETRTVPILLARAAMSFRCSST